MLDVSVDRRSSRSLIGQIADAVRQRIVDGRLPPGARLPATRAFAHELGVSRNVVSEAYEQLVAEGILEGRSGSGTFVAAGLRPPPRRSGGPRQPRRTHKHLVEFHAGNPDLASFPTSAWAQSLRQAVAAARVRDLAYGRPEGASALRQALADHLFRSRGIESAPEHILVVTGIAEAIVLLTMLLRDDGAPPRALIEDPCLHTVQASFRHSAFTLDPVAADLSGMVIDALPARPAGRILYVAPAHQFPLGGTLPAQRRFDLIAYARRHRMWILEDEYDCEFRYAGEPLPPLQSLAPERVITFGTFSKVFFPALRLAYLVLPEPLGERAVRLKRELNLVPPTLEQVALASWIDDGRLGRHVHRMKRIYRRRREHLIAEIARVFGDAAAVRGESAGLHLLVELRHLSLRREDASWLAEQGVDADWAEDYAVVKGRHAHRLVLGYGNLSDQQIAEGVRRLKAAHDALLARRALATRSFP